ncbi:DMT family transporter [Stutzerimonas azotifigens]|uniref:DMT family transporter n=1 Tax=Stutzerimonas azotifigens TaxID=291995 RepID=A0ABR5YX02_9GAMM|nr:DMT family transporter [Stutzerimonas azotifigens]MBA1272460.1 DMT family transporter [Stutzerimonas azotifigens]
MAEQGQRVAMLCLVLAMAIWGSSFIALKLAFEQLEPLWVIFGRMLIGSVVFLLAWRWRGQIRYQAGDWKYLFGMAICEPCLYFVFEALALQRTSASQAGMVTAMLPLMVAIGASLFLRERITRLTLSGFLIAMAGAVWLGMAGEASEQAPEPLLGNFLEFMAMVCATGYMLLVKKLTARYSAFMLTAMQAFIGALFFLPLALWSAPVPQAITPTGVLALFYLGVIVTAGAYGLSNYGLSRMPASKASGYINLIPVFTLLFAVLVLGETLTLTQMLAAGLVFLGVLLSQWRSPAAPPPPSVVLD